MKEYIKMLTNLCEAHDIEIPDDLFELDYTKFGADKEEAMHLINEIHELNCETTYLE